MERKIGRKIKTLKIKGRIVKEKTGRGRGKPTSIVKVFCLLYSTKKF